MEPGGCGCPFNPARSSDICVVGPSAPKVARQGRERTRGGSGQGGAGRSAAVGRRRPISCPAAFWRHSLPGRRSRPRQKGAARSKEVEQLRTATPPPTLPSRSLGPLTGCQLALRTPSGSHSAGSPTPAYRSARLWWGRDARGWPSARPPSRGKREMPHDSRSRFSPALRGWPVAASRWPRHWLPGGLRTLHSPLSGAGLTQIPARGRG